MNGALLTNEQLSASLSVWPDRTGRLALVGRELAAGRNVRILVLGGSNSFGHKTVWWRSTQSWLSHTFPNGEHEFVDASTPACGPDWVDMCWKQYVPDKKIHLVMLEFAVNVLRKAPLHSASTISLESLLRRGLRMGAAVLLVQLSDMRIPDLPRSSQLKDFSQSAPLSVSVTPHFRFDALARHYGVPSVSMQRGVHELWRANVVGFRTDDLMEMNESAIHVTPRGHQYVGEMVAHALVLGASVSQPRTGNGMRSRLDEQSSVPLPSPLLHSTADHLRGSECFLDASLNSLVTSAAGWNTTTEYTRTGFPKRGLVAYAPGAMLRFAVPTAAKHAFLALAYLQSYEHMGEASIRCARNCQCEPALVNAHRPWMRKSITSLVFMELQHASSRACIIEVAITSHSTSGEYKWKLLGAITSTWSAATAARFKREVQTGISQHGAHRGHQIQGSAHGQGL